jgi:flagellar basal-body rod protein FlgG
MSLTANGELVMTSTGMRVLNTADQPIRLDESQKVWIRSNGDVVQGDRIQATLQLVAPQDPEEIVKAGDNVFRHRSGGQIARRAAGGRLHQRFVEHSAVNPITTLKDLVASVKSVQANIKMMQYHDHIMGQAVNTLGRVA